MQAYLSIEEAARRLNIDPEDVENLIRLGILRPKQRTGTAYLFAPADINRITANKGPSLSDQAAEVDTQIHQEMIFSVSTLQKLRRRLSIASLAVAALIVLSVITTALLFSVYPERMSDFFGYYYRFNHLNDSPVLPGGGTSAAGVSAPEEASIKTSVLADVLKPVAATSLVMVKAFDTSQYQQIVAPPVQTAAGQTGPAGSQGPAGLPGVNGKDGLTGPAGRTGLNGTNGVNGTDGVSLQGAAETDTLATVTARGATTGTPVTLSSIANDLTAGTLRLNGDVVNDLTGSGLAVTTGNLSVAGLTNLNFSGAAGISNGNLAHSTIKLNGNSGSVSAVLGGNLTLAGVGITHITGAGSTLTVATTEADTLASVTARGASTAARVTLNGGLTVTGATLSGLANCKRLITNASGAIQCAAVTPAAAGFTDTTPGIFADNDTAQLFNDAAKPNITPDAATQAVLISVHARFTSGGKGDTDAAVRIVRNIGSAASCSGSLQVGDTFSALLMRAGDIQDASGTFLDMPATTAQVFYTVCSSANSQIKQHVPVADRVDVTLIKVGL